MADAQAEGPSRRTDWRNIAVAILTVVVIALGLVVLRDHGPQRARVTAAPTATPAPTPPPEAEPVSILDVRLDRERRRFIDVIFDHPLGKDKLGQVLVRDPMSIKPKTAGVWRWEGANVLRFEPSGGLGMAIEYEVTPLPDQLLSGRQAFTGKTTFIARTDQFRVTRFEARQESVPNERTEVTIHGDLYFNYAVDPRLLATKIRLIDPLRGEGNPVPLQFDRPYPNATISFQSEPIAKSQDIRELKLTIVADLTPSGGNVPLATDFVTPIQIASRGHLLIWAISADPGERESTIRVRLSSAVDADAAAKFVSVTPDPKYRLRSEQNDLILNGAFGPGESYTVTIAEGLTALDESVLAAARTDTIRIPDLTPSVKFQSQGEFLSASGAHAVAIETVNVDTVQVNVDRVYRNNLFFLFGRYDYSYSSYETGEVDDAPYCGTYPLARALGDRLGTTKLQVAGTRNHRIVTTLALDPLIRGHEPGLYRVWVGPDATSRCSSRWLLITDIGIIAKQSEDSFLIWSSSFADLSPIANATVHLISDQNQMIATGQTDAAGMWRITDLEKRLKGGRPYLVTVERGEDSSFLLLNRTAVDTTGLDVSGATRAKVGYEAYLYGERDIYRPGETVKGLALVRDRNLQVPPTMPLLLRHRDPQGRDRGSVRLEMDEDGVASFTHAIPAYEPTGFHSLELLVAQQVIGQYRFQVEEFVPDRIKVGVITPTATVGPGESLTYNVESAYLFGPPAAGLPVETHVRLEPTRFTPKGYEGFTFENSDRTFEAREIFSDQQLLDPEGKHTFATTVPANLAVPSSLVAIITARVQEHGGRGVAAMQRVPVHPYPYYVGVRRQGESYAEPGREITFDYVAVAPDGSEVTPKDLRAELLREEWHTILRRTSSGNYNYESTRETISTGVQVLHPESGHGQFTFTAPQFGEYSVVLTDVSSGASTAVEFFASGWGYSPWAIKHPGHLDLDLDKTEYAPGETAKVQVRAPFSGKLFLTVEREGVYDTYVQMLSGNTAVLEVPIRAEYRPNVYVTATLVRGARDLEPGAVGRAFGAVPLNVDRGSNRMPVSITVPAEARPLQPLSIDIAAAPNAVLTVAAVDEGILQLIAQATPDPFAHFYRKLALGVRSFDIYSFLLPEVAPAQGKSPTGGGEPLRLEKFVRTEGIKRVKPVAFWSGVVHADTDGKATVSFDVPEFQGAVRVMAVAHLGRSFGSAEQMARIRTPLVLLPTVPRFLSFDETAQLPVTVRNDTGKEGAFAVSLRATGPVELPSGPEQSVTVPQGQERTVYFALKSGVNPGDVDLTFQASGNGETVQATANLPLRPDLPPHTITQVGRVTEARTTVPFDAAGFRLDTVQRELRLSPLPLVQFSPQLRYLLHYPYGCIEQTTSTVFPLLYVGDLARQLDPKLFKNSTPEVMVQAGIQRLATMQLGSGGFGMWPGDRSPYLWGSVYATHFLVEARRAGYQIEAFLYDRALEYVSNDVKAQRTYGADDLQRLAYGLYVLARAGKADLGMMDFIREQHPTELRPDSRALLAAAYASTGNTHVLDDMLRDLDDVEQLERQSGGNLNSTIRNRALLLLAFLDAAPQDPRVSTIAERLAREAQTSSMWSTHESALALVALGQLFHEQAAKKPYSGTVSVGDTKIGAFTSTTVSFPSLPGTDPITVQMDEPYDAGAAFFAVQVRGIPTDAAFKPENAGLELDRAFFNRDGTAADLGAVHQGDLLVMRTRLRSLSGSLQNVVAETLLPSGFEVENPRLSTTEKMESSAPHANHPRRYYYRPWMEQTPTPAPNPAFPWIRDVEAEVSFQDIRDDRLLLFANLPAIGWRSTYALLRAVTPGTFRLPPAQAEAMYNPALHVTGERGAITVEVRQ
jgi:uncharacterized protein YfaS (alpha-2-macroglobulin family)